MDYSEMLSTIVTTAGLPAPEREHRFHQERRWRFDLAWPQRLVAVEIEGAVWQMGRHQRPVGYLADIEKYNAAVLLGWRLLRVTPGMVQDGRALELVREALGGDREEEYHGRVDNAAPGAAGADAGPGAGARGTP
jgi:hypothetical protein